MLLRAKKGGEIQAVKPELEALRSRARFFVSLELEERVIAAAGETSALDRIAKEAFESGLYDRTGIPEGGEDE